MADDEKISVSETESAPQAEQTKTISRNPFIGFWHYGVVLTYIAAILAIVGICFSAMHKTGIAIILLMASGLCDLFDGTVARTRKDRTDDDKMYGIQIDSLSDLLAFGVAPIMIGVSMGIIEWYFIIVYCVYVLCALIRLGFFNVREILHSDEGSRPKAFMGVPVTQITTVLPIFYLVATMFSQMLVTKLIMTFMFLLYAALMISKVRIPKPRLYKLIIMNILFFTTITALFLIRWYVCGVHTL